jgi:hypothetical protein
MAAVTTNFDLATRITTVTVPPSYRRADYETALHVVFLSGTADRILADHTAEGPVWGPEDLEGHLHFLRSVRNVIPLNSRVAILCSDVLDFGIARMMQMLTETELPCLAQVFLSRQEAVGWLLEPA